MLPPGLGLLLLVFPLVLISLLELVLLRQTLFAVVLVLHELVDGLLDRVGVVGEPFGGDRVQGLSELFFLLPPVIGVVLLAKTGEGVVLVLVVAGVGRLFLLGAFFLLFRVLEEVVEGVEVLDFCEGGLDGVD